MNKNKKGQAGFVVTVELLLITVVLVIGLISGFAKVRDQANAELSDLGNEIGSIDNSYKLLGIQWQDGGGVGIAATASFGFTDAPDQAVFATQIGGDAQKIKYRAAGTSSTSDVANEANSLF